MASMVRMLIRCVVFAAITLAIFAARTTAQPEASLDASDGQRFAEKLKLIMGNAASGSQIVKPMVVYQHEINAFLHYQAASKLPQGLSEIEVSLNNLGRLSVRSTVDLSKIRSEQARQYLSGRHLFEVDGLVQSKGGVGLFEIQSVTFGSIPVPVSVLSELVRNNSRNKDRPNGIDIGESFKLPYGITELRVEHERVIVIQ